MFITNFNNYIIIFPCRCRDCPSKDDEEPAEDEEDYDFGQSLYDDDDEEEE